MASTTRRRGSIKKLAGILVAMLGLSTLAITPTTAAQFLTKQKADKRYLGNTSEVTNSAVVGPFEGASITAVCPPGRQAVGGGADSPAAVTTIPVTQGMFLAESKPVMAGGRSVGWNAEVINLSMSDPSTITVHAVCVP